MSCTAQPTHVRDASTLITVWRKSHHSNPSGECVELGVLDDGVTIAMRNSRHPHGPALLFDAESVCELIDAAKDDRLDWTFAYSRFQQTESGTYVRGGSGESGPGAHPYPAVAPPAVGLDHHC